MDLSSQKKIFVPMGVLVSQVGDESVILNLETEYYFGLDDVGARMWNALTTSPTLQSAYESLLGEYDVDEQMLRQDLMGLIEKLLAHGLVEVEEA